MYSPDHPTELFRERQEPLARELRDNRLAKRPRSSRREKSAPSGRRTARFLGRAIASWGRTSVLFLRA